jgi:hypothetical protein
LGGERQGPILGQPAADFRRCGLQLMPYILSSFDVLQR